MTVTPNLGLTLVETAQGQKEVTVNEALCRIDALLNSGAADRDVNTPPGSPSAGDMYILGASPTGAWAGKAAHLAYFDGVWRFITPNEGATVWVKDEDVHYTYDGSDWVAGSGGGGGGGGSSLTLTSTDAGGDAGPDLILYRNSASPAASDILGRVLFRGKDASGNTESYAEIYSVLKDPAHASEDAELHFRHRKNGDMTLAAVIDENSHLLIAKAAPSFATVGIELRSNGALFSTVDNSYCAIFNRLTSDGTLIEFRQAGTIEGMISVAGTTVTYGAFCGGHWSQLEGGGNPDIPRGTVVSTVDAMCSWPGEENDQLAAFRVSDTTQDRRVYGVFCNWDEEGDAIIQALGATVIRVTGPVSGGDLLESAGDGTARAQTDDVIRAHTIGKATVGDGRTDERLLPCVLYCG